RCQTRLAEGRGHGVAARQEAGASGEARSSGYQGAAPTQVRRRGAAARAQLSLSRLLVGYRQAVAERRNFDSGTPWERLAGCSAGVRLGGTVWVSGTTASDAEGRVHGDDAAAQTEYILRKIEATLGQAGAKLNDVVRTRIYVARLEDWEAVARVHGAVFGEIRPANTLVQVAGLVDGRLVGIETEPVLAN